MRHWAQALLDAPQFLVNTAIEWSVARIFRVLAWPTGCLILDAAGAGMEYRRRTPVRAKVGDQQIHKANKISRDFRHAETRDLSSTRHVLQALDLEAMD